MEFESVIPTSSLDQTESKRFFSVYLQLAEDSVNWEISEVN